MRFFDPTWERLATLPPVPAADPDRPRSFPLRLAYVLAQAMVDRVLRQGERLPGAAALASRFGGTVDQAREAVRILIAHGLVAREPGGAAYIRGTAVLPDLDPPPAPARSAAPPTRRRSQAWRS